ncbi:MAG: hypothetical protein RL311_11 [Bacteroidota bacterium]|jgi:hypothetical protein
MKNVSFWITIVAFLDTVYGFIAENQGLLIEIGISEKWTKIIMFVGLLVAAFSKSLKPIDLRGISSSNRTSGGGVIPRKSL